MLKILSKSVLLLSAVVLLSACGGSSTTKMDKPKEPVKPAVSLGELARSLKTEPACIAKGGEWRRMGRIQQLSCVLPTSDAGKACTDSSQCEVSCLVSKPGVEAGTATVGQCNSSTDIFGCNMRVIDGKADGMLCID
ncbi:hypothetical protein [Leucothrix pacifica]|uniref:Secreted protein n=1 Tax=Leucothrix pacifica TaxID=1247513 RepID=A0A317CCF7_9GAMM|nr:hypothetical protein [Leucothrix pacifica]PWQ96069.1 hypothetical protein DKW60_13530 [Leucothrix pacifica]